MPKRTAMVSSSISRKLAWAACVLAVALFGSYATARADDQPGLRVADRVFTDPASPVVAHAGELILISQESNPSTGYHWVDASPPDPAVVALRGVAFMATSGLIGAPGREIRVYESTGSGSTTITLSYMPPGKGTKAAKQVTFHVTVTPADAR